MPTGTRTGRATRKSATSTPATPAVARSTTARGGPSAGSRRRGAAHKWVYLFEDGDATMRDLLGGKGAGVAEMTKAGLPVPPGFTITTEACNEYYRLNEDFPPGLWDQLSAGLKSVEMSSGKTFGDPANPLLVSVRSGAKFSMPGMMDTVLNLGLNDATVEGMIALTDNPRFVYDSYRRFLMMLSDVAYSTPTNHLSKHDFEHIF